MFSSSSSLSLAVVALAQFAEIFSVSATAVPRAEKRALAQVITKCTVPNTVALTFDDGPYIWAKEVGDALIAAGGKGTFFFNGNNYRCIYEKEEQDRVRYLHSQGHQLASHTWRHAHLTQLSFDQNHDEFWRVEQALQRIAGVTPAFMRPPYGEYNDVVRQVASARGQKLVIWDFDSGDSTGSTVAQSKSMYDSVVSRHPSTLLALNHEVYDSTVHQLLPYAISKLKAAGYRLVTVAECLGQQPYQSTTAPQTPSTSWKCT